MKNAFPDWIFLLFLGFFLLLWILASLLLSKLGWSRLRAFYCFQTPQGNKHRMQNVRIEGCVYRDCMTIIIAKNGVYLHPVWILSAFHPPILIPWVAFHSWRDEKVRWFPATAFLLQTAPKKFATITLESVMLRRLIIEEITAFQAANSSSLR